MRELLFIVASVTGRHEADFIAFRKPLAAKRQTTQDLPHRARAQSAPPFQRQSQRNPPQTPNNTFQPTSLRSRRVTIKTVAERSRRNRFSPFWADPSRLRSRWNHPAQCLGRGMLPRSRADAGRASGGSARPAGAARSIVSAFFLLSQKPRHRKHPVLVPIRKRHHNGYFCAKHGKEGRNTYG